MKKPVVYSNMNDVLAKLRPLLAIDKLALDDEIVRQPTLFYEVADACADAVAERDACKEELETVDAELDGIVRKRLAAKAPPTKSRGAYPTEAMVKHAIQTDDRHSAAFDTYILAKTRADKLLNLKDAFKDRSFMLRELVGLQTTGYFETAAIRGDAKTDRFVYDKTRQRLAEARAKRVK